MCSGLVERGMDLRYVGYKMDRWSFFALLLIVSECQNLEIKELKMPALVELGSDAEFHCSLDLGEHENATWLEMHWYFQPEGEPADKMRRLYQWLLGREPEVFERDGSIIVTCSEDHPNLKKDECGFRLIAPGPSYSGNYSCTVFTFDSEKRKTLPLVVYTNKVQPEILVVSPTDGVSSAAEDYTDALPTSWFVCKALGAHPKPELRLFVNGEEATSEQEAPLKPDAAGFYNLSRRVALKETADPVELTCQLVYPSLPGVHPRTASYTHNEEPAPEVVTGPSPAFDAEGTPPPKAVLTGIRIRDLLVDGPIVFPLD